MSWNSSTRSTDLPDDWEELRSLVLQEAGWICQIGLPDCLTEANEVDHIRRGNDHSRRNLRAACRRCHGKKSSAEGHARKREMRALRKRPPERHPGTR